MALWWFFVSWLFGMISSAWYRNSLEEGFLEIDYTFTSDINLTIIPYVSILEFLAAAS